ncbi:hypothetical protein N0V82_002540 [Gnomoniopsis sp. IMI 355080]|nr:hypothetical protein N0V82_002540 [Gnomoniopsis sp. IMI 355080]
MVETQELTISTRPASKQAGEAQPDRSSASGTSGTIPESTISKTLYHKAYASNDQLTKLERLLLLSRCDVPGKALAQPDTLTEAERNQVLWRPPPAQLATNIRAMTNNAMSTIPELVADQGRSLDWMGALAVLNSFWYGETRSLQGIQSPEFYGAANNAAARLHERPAERALHLEVARRLHDPVLKAELVAATGKMDPVSGKVILAKQDRMSSQEMASAQQERRASLLCQKKSTRAEISARVLAELESLSEVERKEMQELREWERMKHEREVVDDAREAERKAVERRNEIEAAEEEAKEEVRRRRRRKRAALQAKYGDNDYSDSDSDGNDTDKGQFPTSEDTY